MLLPFDIGQIHGALSLAYKVIEIGWGDVHDAHQQYNEFRQDIEILTRNLSNLASLIYRAQAEILHDPGPPTATLRNVGLVVGNFTSVLEDCWSLLDQRATFGNQQGPVYNLQWFMNVKDDVQMLRDRIAACNIKLSISLACLELERQDGTIQLLRGLGDFLDVRLTQLEQRLTGEPAQPEPRRRIDIPLSIQDMLRAMATSRHGHVANVPIDQGINETVFYLDRATQWHRRRQSEPSSPPCRASRLYNLFRAWWLLEATRSGDAFRALSQRTTTFDDYQQQHLPRLGMTPQTFMRRLEERVSDAYNAFILEGGQLPDEAALMDVARREGNSWETHHIWRLPQQEDDDPRRGEMVFKCRLQDFNTAEQWLEVWQNEQSNARQLTVITHGANRADRVYQVDLGTLQLAPNDDAFLRSSDRFSVALNPIRQGGQPGFKLAFHNRGGLFEFQEFVTGYKVVDDFIGATVVSQRAGRLVGGEQRTEIARVQLWESTTRPTGRRIPREFLDDLESTSTLRNLSRTASPPPVLPSLESISSLTLSQHSEAVVTPTTSPGSSSPSVDAQHLPPGSPRRPSEAGRTMSFAVPHNPDRRSMATQEIPYLQAQMNSATRNRNPDLGWDQTSQVQRSPPQQQSSPPLGLGAHLTRRASRAMSIMSRSSTSSVAQSTMSGNIVRVDTSGTLGCIIDSPDPSRLILFLKGRTQFDTHALLVIDITNEVTINPDLCGCRQEGSSYTTASTCTMVVLQGRNRADIPAKETIIPPSRQQTSSRGGGKDVGLKGGNMYWNLASAGRYQPDGEGLVKVRRLRLVTIELGSDEARRNFVGYFNTLRQHYMQTVMG
ncbi:hypothetical protein QBC42DRAFT_262958 [Cladorrhinum samala]|uniref:Uncharacterized protein n=1 Tax=Cladorrhinum samala TaxID=585594 RepID=A0AAV9HXI7_9PEZI|nr:hypothetical protein QBC42DRAFT_262958 [Cladorrhinum samala]